MHTLFCDTETYSSVDLTECGLYKYVEAPDFQVLLIAYSVDGGPVKVIDEITGDDFDAHSDFLDMLIDPDYIKVAHNAAFERQVFAKWVDEPMPAEQWRCTMVHALMCGLPASLAAAGAALGLPEDKQKDKQGKALIDYFCKPCKPTKANGGRVRNLPAHDPDKWRLFIEYNRQDVVTEMAIEKRLDQILKVPEGEQRLWELDQMINDHGVRLDVPMIEKIVAYDDMRSEELKKEAAEITGLSNTNSLMQLKGWLTKQGVSVDTLRKDDLDELLSQDLPDKVRRVLEIRQALGKTSTAKYAKMLDAVNADGRLRGILQFYGANRSGRWCLTGDHEVLTPKGWVRLDQWTGGPIMCWDKAAETISFQKAECVSFDYDGPMVSWKTQRIDQLATPDHKMACLNEKTGAWEIKKIEDMTGRVIIPFTGARQRATEPGNNWPLRLLVATQADGTYTDDGVLRFHFSKTRKIDRLIMLLRKNEITYTVQKNGDRTTTISIAQRYQPIWIRQFRNKIFDYWILDENLTVFFDELPHWDGYYSADNSMQYVTCIKQNADVVQAAAICSGMSAGMIVKKRSDKWHDAYVVSVWLKPGRGTRVNTKDAQIVEHHGKIYCASTKTGFFIVRRNGKVWVTGNTGKLVQVHNLARNSMPDLDLAREITCSGDFDELQTLFGETSFVFSELVRTAFIPSEGHLFVVSDFSAIEARVIAWVAGEDWVLDAFRQGKDIYCETASMMYHVPVEKHGQNKHLRQKGKIAVLACGYQGGVGAMRAMDKGGTIPDEELQSVVDQWRQANPKIVKLWRTVELAAKSAIEDHKAHTINHNITLTYRGGNLYISLPSGRSLVYYDARLKEGKYGDQIVYKGVNQTTKKWEDTETYGGKLVENIVQAIARDCLAEAMQRVAKDGMQIVMHVHDEMIADVPGDIAETILNRINGDMSQPIDWAPGLPLKGDGYVCDFYRKD